MFDIINLIFGCFLNVVVLIYMCKTLAKKEIKYFSKQYILIVLLMTSYWSISYVMTNNIIRILISFLLLVIACLVLFKEKTNKSVIISFISTLILLISEIFYVAVNVYIFKFDISELQNNVFGTFITNILILIIALIIFNIITKNKKLNKLLEKIMIKNKNSNFHIFFTAFSTIIMLIYCIYFEEELYFSLIYCILIVIAYVIFTINLVKEKANNYKLQEENKSMLLSLEEYEKMYSHQRMKNHEYKNDLSVLRGIISKENKNALNFIDEIIKIKSNEKHNWMEVLKRIPEGGLRGILYYKFLEMEEKKVKIEFTVTKNYKPTTYSILSEELKIKICKLLGIYLDNAIQAIEHLEEKNIYVNIDENKENILLKIANNFSGNIDLDRINEKGYTTKEKGHGYGLSIAKEIIDGEKNINMVTKIIKDKFIQEISIKK